MRRIGFAFAALLIAACATSDPGPPKVPLSKRASIDFGCPASELNINSDDDQLWQVRGCNRIGYYVKRCGQCLDAVSLAASVPVTSSCDCEWILTRRPAQ